MAKKSPMDDTTQIEINRNDYEEFKSACKKDELAPAELLNALMKEYTSYTDTERALFQTKYGIGLSGPFNSVEELMKALNEP